MDATPEQTGSYGLDELVTTMDAILERCVWSKQMTHESLLPYLIEESYEFSDVVIAGASRERLIDELGDVLWQVVFHAAIASREPGESFNIEDVAHALTVKMRRRHPHVFGAATAETPEEVMRLWNAAKAAEREDSGRAGVILSPDGSAESTEDDVPGAKNPLQSGLPTLVLAAKLLKRAEVRRVAGAAARDAVADDPMKESFTGCATDAIESPAASDNPDLAYGRRLLALLAEAKDAGVDGEVALRAALQELSEKL